METNPVARISPNLARLQTIADSISFNDLLKCFFQVMFREMAVSFDSSKNLLTVHYICNDVPSSYWCTGDDFARLVETIFTKEDIVLYLQDAGITVIQKEMEGVVEGGTQILTRLQTIE